MIPLLIGTGIGFILAKVIDSNEEVKEKIAHSPTFHLFIKSEDFGKSNLSFLTYDEAKKMFDKIIALKKVKYKDIVANDESEKKLFDKWKEEDNIGKTDYPKLSDESKVSSIIFSMFDTAGKEYVYEEIEF